jgi:hypothetical protein
VGDFGEGVAGAVAAGGRGDVAVGHLAMIRSSLDAARFEARSDGSSMDTELRGEIGQLPSCLILAHEFVDLEIGQAMLHRLSGWV